MCAQQKERDGGNNKDRENYGCEMEKVRGIEEGDVETMKNRWNVP